ncbi:hypothetical protein RB195_005788 [Necator americanus]|uniref:Uncharacterized protein n=1 Tax=Necator americanus TaxID=51031 RepID=A0ABR1BPL5_NECAM
MGSLWSTGHFDTTMRLSYVLFALLVFITLRVEASFFGHHHHGFGYYPVIAAAAPFYYAHYPLYSYHGKCLGNH